MSSLLRLLMLFAIPDVLTLLVSAESCVAVSVPSVNTALILVWAVPLVLPLLALTPHLLLSPLP
ncbi:hypothetical protein, partial [Anaplasma marginale]|uniref:hypothetical protein n=1 Tax=Anaplasma marginale TaxID=770 RepID=UPI0019D6B7A8